MHISEFKVTDKLMRIFLGIHVIYQTDTYDFPEDIW